MVCKAQNIQKGSVHPGIAENFYTWSGFVIHGAFYLIFTSEINVFPLPFAGILKTIHGFYIIIYYYNYSVLN